LPKISKRTVDAAQPGATVWDTSIPRFGLRVSKKGVRSYILKYRVNGQQRWYTIGQHGRPVPNAKASEIWTPDRARREAFRILGQVEAGEDPAAQRRENREAITLGDFAERYFSDHVEAHNKPSTIQETRRNLDNHVLPKLARGPATRLKDIKRQDVVRFHLGMKDSPYAANRCLALVSHMLAQAEEWGLLAEGSTICRRIKKFREEKRRRFLSPAELGRLGDALQRMEDTGTNANAIAIIRLLALTGARRGEIERLTWPEIDFERQIIELRDSKTGAKYIPLAPPALEILAKHPRLQSSDFVFPAASSGGHYQGLMKIWLRVRKHAGLDDVRIHDLRHSFASVGASGGLGLPVIGKILGHASPATTARYAHLADDPVRAAATSVATAIAANLSGAPENVVTLKPAKQR
jgi:integrase